MTEPRYYEIEAAIVAQCRVEDMFEGPKTKEAVLARQLAMCFRKEAYKESHAVIAERYGKDHATLTHALKTIKAFADTNKEFREIKEDYIRRCYYFKAKFERAAEIKLTIEQVGIKEFIRQGQAKLTTLSSVLNDFLSDDCSEKEVMQAINNTENTIGEMKYIFEV